MIKNFKMSNRENSNIDNNFIVNQKLLSILGALISIQNQIKSKLFDELLGGI